jgi:glutamate dehydrogenase
LARQIESSDFPHPRSHNEKREVIEFLRLLIDGGFIFIGKLSLDREQIKDRLGIFKLKNRSQTELLSEITEEVNEFKKSDEIIKIVRTRSKSPFHRLSRMMMVAVKRLSSSGKITSIDILVGLLTSKMRSLESSLIPIIRSKISELVEHINVLPNSHSYKRIVNLIDNVPKYDTLRFDVASLNQLTESALNPLLTYDTKVVILLDHAGRSATVMISMPRDRFSAIIRRRLQRAIEEAFQAEHASSEYTLDVSDSNVARFYISVSATRNALEALSQSDLKERLIQLTKNWNDKLEEAIKIEPSIPNAQLLINRYRDAFPEDYRALHSAEDALYDIFNIEKSLDTSLPVVAIRSTDQLSVLIYQNSKELSLSQILPVLENIGFEVIKESTSKISPRGSILSVYLYRCSVKLKNSTFNINQQDDFDKNLSHIVSPGIAAVLSSSATNDPLNQLLLSAAMPLSNLAVLRAYASHLSQINKYATRHAIYQTLSAHPAVARELWRAFDIKFNPQLTHSIEKRSDLTNQIFSSLNQDLVKIKDITQDRILRALISLIKATIRTNFYTQFYSQHSIISLKIHSESIDLMPQPKPLFEVFVSGSNVEGIHLRSAKVSRGGIRWSDRRDDYRTEVLGLMKTQKIKNSLIVPQGAKGGFIVKAAADDPRSLREQGELSYSNYIRALLSITDNLNKNQVVRPKDVLAYEGDDPYFVVAADKGTATFSDMANKIAIEEFHFWLGDAFASGGSKGYDHKLYGITARGAWECVKHHFLALGRDPLKEPFTAIGIGDMSGDVFGNGMIYSKEMRLIAAFDHHSIFVDPSPNNINSFGERQRLFKLKGSSWNDYTTELISKGGGIFHRSEKEIALSPEIRQALEIPEAIPNTVSGEQLITLILKAPVDLLWNGGIGSYVKGSSESHADVNDSSNDGVRINGAELRAKIVAEGGNLGFTQQARCEYSLHGGKINTDAIDNSGGVDLSDHEVNIKILFSTLVESGKLDEKKRIKSLKTIDKALCQSVLAHNRAHAEALSLAEKRSRRNIFFFKSLLTELSRGGFINRILDRLPDDGELEERGLKREGMLRPELAIIISAVKMWTKQQILESGLAREGVLQRYLTGYFPGTLVEEYHNAILAHPLAEHITATEITNLLVESYGVTFFHRMTSYYSVPAKVVIASSIASELILNLSLIRSELSKLATPSNYKEFLALQLEITRLLRATSSWLISSYLGDLTITELVSTYAAQYQALIKNPSKILQITHHEDLTQKIEQLTNIGLSSDCAQQVAMFNLIVPLLEILQIASRNGYDLQTVSLVYSTLVKDLGVANYVTLGTAMETNNRWDNELRITAYEEIRRALSIITIKLLHSGINSIAETTAKLGKTPGHRQLIDGISELQEVTINPVGLSAIARRLGGFSRSLK